MTEQSKSNQVKYTGTEQEMIIQKDSLHNIIERKTLADSYGRITLSPVGKERLKANIRENLGAGRRFSFFKYQGGRRLYLAKAATAAGLVLALSCVGMTAHASYTLYQSTHLRVFFERGVDQQQIDRLGDEIRRTDGVAACRYVNADEAWKDFQEEYLTSELAEAFEENPLADSYNYEIRITLDADAERIKEALSELEGVRSVSGFWEE